MASTSASVSRIIDPTNANVRPRSSSGTSSPSIVLPVIQPTPAKKPITKVSTTTTGSCWTSAIGNSSSPVNVSEMPNMRRRESPCSSRGPRHMPSPSPANTVPNSRP